MLEIFPNPFNQVTTIQYFLSKKEKINLAIYNTNGIKVFTSENLPNKIGWNNMEFKAEDLPSGIYQVALYTEKGIIVRNIVIAK